MTFPLPALRCWKQILHTFANWSVQWQSWQTRYGCRHRIHNDHKPYFLPVAVVLETMVQKTKCWRLWCWNIKLLIRKAKCRCEIMMHSHINNRAGNFGLMILQTMDLQTSQLIHTVCLLQCLYNCSASNRKSVSWCQKQCTRTLNDTVFKDDSSSIFNFSQKVLQPVPQANPVHTVYRV